MSEMTTGLETALQGARPTVFGAIEINFPGADLRLLDGSAQIVIAGNTFSGRDATYGTIASCKAVTDGGGDQAPTLTIGLLPPSATARTALASASMQGARVRLWMGVVDPVTGLVVPDPLVLFDGEIDVPTMKWGQRTREVEYRVVSVFERFFDLEEGIRLSDSHHQALWPGELGLAYVTGVTENVYWGADAPRSAVTSVGSFTWGGVLKQ